MFIQRYFIKQLPCTSLFKLIRINTWEQSYAYNNIQQINETYLLICFGCLLACRPACLYQRRLTSYLSKVADNYQNDCNLKWIINTLKQQKKEKKICLLFYRQNNNNSKKKKNNHLRSLHLPLFSFIPFFLHFPLQYSLLPNPFAFLTYIHIISQVTRTNQRRKTRETEHQWLNDEKVEVILLSDQSHQPNRWKQTA